MANLALFQFARAALRWSRSSLHAAVAAVSLLSLAVAPSLAQRSTPPTAPVDAFRQAAAGFHELFLHDECIGENTQQPDTCLHVRKHEKSFTFGGKTGTVYNVTLRVRGLFEPTTIVGGEAPDPAHPFFMVGGLSRTTDYSQWSIEVSEPKQTYTLNHYPATSHTIYKEDFEATVAVAAGASVVIRVVDSNDRQIDNGDKLRSDRQQIISGVVDTPLAGQMVRFDVVRVAAR
ncbi:MAG: hypothetical protein ABIQ86_15410 [Steroidobacteraceae bacterium]